MRVPSVVLDSHFETVCTLSAYSMPQLPVVSVVWAYSGGVKFRALQVHSKTLTRREGCLWWVMFVHLVTIWVLLSLRQRSVASFWLSFAKCCDVVSTRPEHGAILGAELTAWIAYAVWLVRSLQRPTAGEL
jgi:hypothetical protein